MQPLSHGRIKDVARLFQGLKAVGDLPVLRILSTSSPSRSSAVQASSENGLVMRGCSATRRIRASSPRDGC